ncbi:DivIVA domain-containing protein [Streptomyces sp. NPDC090306]|uniref:DivIVA domain-containing protein n=1 Tax=unclassified Streptomyces TaxID=2593676 RepID=UPI0036E75E62
MSERVSTSSEFRGFTLVRRGYDREQVDRFLALLALPGAPRATPSFDIVRRGYDRREVDERIRELRAGGPAAP